jgi:hypothetical protein
MGKLVRHTAVALMASAVLVALPAGDALASTHPAFFSSDQAGYAVTGGKFIETEVWARLPDASRFSREVGRVGASIELSNKRILVDLMISACTDATCRPGGRPVRRKYHLNFSIFNSSTHKLICSTSATVAKKRCASVPAAWRKFRLRAGRTVNLVLYYASTFGNVEADASGPGNSGATYDRYVPGTGKVFRQARIAAQFGSSPWSANRYRAPAAPEHLITFGIPPGPAVAAEFALANHQGTCPGSWRARHRVAMTLHGVSGTRRRAIASKAWHYGCDFNITLEP